MLGIEDIRQAGEVKIKVMGSHYEVSFLVVFVIHGKLVRIKKGGKSIAERMKRISAQFQRVHHFCALVREDRLATWTDHRRMTIVFYAISVKSYTVHADYIRQVFDGTSS